MRGRNDTGGSIWTWMARGAVVALTVAAGCTSLPPLVERPPGPPPPTLIRNVRIYDGVSDRRSAPQDVLLENGRIARIAGPGTIPAARGVHQIDGAGRTLLPGLIDVHGHLGTGTAPPWIQELPDPKRSMQAYLYCGITTVLDPADLATEAFERRDAVGRGDLLGPHIFAAGPMFTAPGGHPVSALRELTPWWLRWYVVPRLTRQVRTPAEARAAVHELAELHPDVIKTAVDAVPEGEPILDPATLQAIVEAARAHGIRTVAHVGTTADALEAADAGVAAWMHGVYKERIPDEAIPRLAAAHIPEVATLTVFDDYADLYEQHYEPTPLERETVAPQVLAALTARPADYHPSAAFERFFALLAATRDARRDNVRRMHAAGVTILAGSDTQTGTFPGAGLHRELKALVGAGLTPAQALRAATGDAARFVANRADPEFGTVAAGNVADLLLVEGDPTADIADVSRIVAVILGGVELVRRPVAAAP